MTNSPEPFQPNATVNVHRDGDIISIVHMTRLGSRHVIPLSVAAARMLADELSEQSRPDFSAEPKPATKEI
jgi:hypothetical protein